MLLTDVLNKFNELYGKYNEPDNEGVINNKDNIDDSYNSELDNSGTIKKDSNNYIYNHDIEPTGKNIDFKHNLDNNVSDENKDDLKVTEYNIDNNTDNNSEQINPTYNTDIIPESEIIKNKIGYSSDINFTNTKQAATHKNMLDNVLENKIDPESNYEHDTKFEHEDDYNNVYEHDTKFEHEDDINTEYNHDLNFKSEDSIKSSIDFNNDVNLDDNKVDYSNENPIYNDNNSDLANIEKNWKSYLDNADLTKTDDFWNALKESELNSNGSLTISKVDFMNEMSNLFHEQVSRHIGEDSSVAQKILNNLTGEFVTSKDLFKNKLMNITSNVIGDVQTLLVKEAKKAKDEIVRIAYNTYSILRVNLAGNVTDYGQGLFNVDLKNITGINNFDNLKEKGLSYLKGKAFFDGNTENTSSSFKGYQSIQESLKYGLATDFYWDIILKYHANTNSTDDSKNPIQKPNFPFAGGWWPIKSFDLGQDYLNTQTLSAGEMQIKILTDRAFPKTITLNVVEDYWRQLEFFGRAFNNYVYRLSKDGSVIVPYEDQSFDITISYYLPHFETKWKEVTYIAIPEFKYDMKGTDSKTSPKEYSIIFNIIGLKNFNNDNAKSFNYRTYNEDKKSSSLSKNNIMGNSKLKYIPTKIIDQYASKLIQF